MSGWPAVALFTTLAVVALVGLNVGLYRRMKAATAAGRAGAGIARRQAGEDVDA